MKSILLFLLVFITSGKKSKPSYQVFEPAIPWIQCDVCNRFVHNAAAMVEEVRRNESRKTPIQEDEILEQMELACNPFTDAGSWIRYLDVVLIEEGTRALLSEVEFLTQCKRDCYTIMEACVQIQEHDGADVLPSLLLKNKKSVSSMQKSVCAEPCSSFRSLMSSKAKKRLSSEIGLESPQEIPSKEYQIEEMMDKMERNHVPGMPHMDFYSRDEMLQMQGAIADGDQELLKQYDPKADDLSKEEFEELRRMYVAEGHGSAAVESEGQQVGEDVAGWTKPAPVPDIPIDAANGGNAKEEEPKRGWFDWFY